MTQAFNVLLKNVGPRRVAVFALVRQQTGLRPEEFRRLADAGDLIVAQDVMRTDATNLAEELRRLGATAEIEISICDGG